MNFNKLVWPLISLLVIIFLINFTGSFDLIFQMNFWWFLVSVFFFFLSTAFWAVAWARVFKMNYWKAVILNTRSLVGTFTPGNLGGDVLRSYFAKEEDRDPARALASSSVIKFFKFILMGVFLIYTLFFISGQKEFPPFSIAFIFMIIFTFSAAIFVLLLTGRKIPKLFKHKFVAGFNKELNKYFSKISIKTSLSVIFWLLVSTFCEVLAVAFAFKALGIAFTYLGIFIVSVIINSFVVASITPQGIGIVEAGGYFILSFSMFYMSQPEIGSFLILWNIIRVWVPTLLGLALYLKK